MSSRYDRILKALEPLQSTQLMLIDESHKHAGHIEHHGDAVHAGETHFLLLVVSEKFQGVSRIDRQRMVNALLDIEFKNGLHALQMKLHSPNEYGQVIANKNK